MIFAHTTTLSRDGDPVVFLAGAEVPEWAENEVGSHLLVEAAPLQATQTTQDVIEQTADGAAAQAEAAVVAVEGVPDDAAATEDVAEEAEKDGAAPDFTGPAKPARSRSQRSR